jgi:hypothetical protein
VAGDAAVSTRLDGGDERERRGIDGGDEIVYADAASDAGGWRGSNGLLPRPVASINFSAYAPPRRLRSWRCVRVTHVRSTGPGRQDLDIEAPLVCERRDGMLESVQQAVLSVARIRGTYRVARLARAGCKVVRARGSDEPL